MYEDLNDLVSVICPIESQDDPVWEKGARSIIMATAIAMLEDSENPELGMTKDKLNFFNINKAIGNSDNNFEPLKNYFVGRDVLSKAVTLSRQVLSAAENTLASYMSIAFDKLSIFNDEGSCYYFFPSRLCMIQRSESYNRCPAYAFDLFPSHRDTFR